MRAGRLRKKVTFETRGTTKSNTGEPVNTWTDIATRSASIEPLMGKEFYSDSGEHSRHDTRIRVRWDNALDGLKPFDRVIDKRRSPQVVYDIESVQNPREKNRELVLMCKRDG